jgi:uncharacterized membrane protein (DUF2068 family)
MTDSSSPSLVQPKHRNQWLILIAAFKVGQALLFGAIGVGALRLLHKDVGDELQKLADHLHFNPEWHVVKFLLDRASILNDRMVLRISFGVFSYATLCMAEGIGLYLEKIWAEYMTLAITASFLPWEIFEIFRHVTPIKVGRLLINALVLFYLVKLAADRAKLRRSCEIQ